MQSGGKLKIMDAAIVYAAMPATAALLVIVHKLGVKQAKEARVRSALKVHVRHILGTDFVLLWPDGERS